LHSFQRVELDQACPEELHRLDREQRRVEPARVMLTHAEAANQGLVRDCVREPHVDHGAIVDAHERKGRDGITLFERSLHAGTRVNDAAFARVCRLHDLEAIGEELGSKQCAKLVLVGRGPWRGHDCDARSWLVLRGSLGW
jgi:hypothetical protein